MLYQVDLSKSTYLVVEAGSQAEAVAIAAKLADDYDSNWVRVGNPIPITDRSMIPELWRDSTPCNCRHGTATIQHFEDTDA